MSNNRFTFNFTSLVWMNLRSKIRSLSLNSVWYQTLKALLLILSERAERISWLYQQIWLESASEYGLTLWGQRFGIPRLYGENDVVYKSRILQERLLTGSGATNSARKKAGSYVFSVPPENISIKQLDLSFSVGEEIGNQIGTLNYLKHVYRVYFVGVENPTEQQTTKFLALLDSINIGGNVPELWFEKTSGYANVRELSSDLKTMKSFEVIK